ncbi:MAG: hypothetical protein AAF800_14805, partial [Planctomycetota bacterium]
MTHRRTAAALCLTLGLTLPALTQPPAAAETAALEDLAADGRFGDLLDAVRARPDADADDPTRALIRQLERFQSNEARRSARRAAAYDRAIAEMGQKKNDGNLEDALVAAIEAHSIAEAPLLVLRDPAVVDLVARTEIAAKQAELDEDWVEAAVLFGRLNLLFEEDKRYRNDLKRVNSHLRVLALYTPDVLRDLQRARAERLGREDQLPEDRPDDETWEVRLGGIDAEMLRESVRTAAERHIDHEGYAQLLAGAVEPLLVLLDTPALAQTFPGLKNPTQRDAFRGELLRLKGELDAGGAAGLTRFRAMSRIDEVLAHNRRTVALPESVVAYEMTEGAMGTLDDFSSMYWPEDIDFLSRSTQGSFTGIGVQIARRDQQLTVVSPLNGTPAQRAGLKAGDVIATV